VVADQHRQRPRPLTRVLRRDRRRDQRIRLRPGHRLHAHDIPDSAARTRGEERPQTRSWPGTQALRRELTTRITVRYKTAANLVNELAEAADDRQLTRVLARYGRADLLCLDELGYLELDKTGAKLLFQIFTDREERRAIAVASNAPFSEWKRTFTDPRLCSAIVDRLTYNAHIIETGTDSFRLAQASRARTGH